MNKLLKAFMDNPTALTAANLLNHLRKHPMCACALPVGIEEQAIEFGGLNLLK
tara:strand:- start:438 stop:596 length:159 start_codon:yes stop_codon:yes gene_type:complete